MTTLHACLQEIIEKGPGFFIRSYDIPGAYRISEWDSPTLLAEIEHESPGVLNDHAWLEWYTRPGVGLTGSINYGTRGFSMSNREVPAYGHLRVLESSQRYQPLNPTRTSSDLLASLPTLRDHRSQRKV